MTERRETERRRTCLGASIRVACRQETRRARLVWRRGGEAGIRFETEALSVRATGTAQDETFAAAERPPRARLH